MLEEEGRLWEYKIIRYYPIEFFNTGLREPDGNISIRISEELPDNIVIRIKVDEEYIIIPMGMMKNEWFEVGCCDKLIIRKIVNGKEEDVKGLVKETRTYLEPDEETEAWEEGEEREEGISPQEPLKEPPK